MFRGDELAVGVYSLAFLFTLICALWERGFNGGAQGPRRLGPAIMFVLVLLTLPVLRAIRLVGWRMRPVPAGAAAVVLAVLVAVPVGLHHGTAVAQQAPLPDPAAIDTMTPAAGDDWPVYG